MNATSRLETAADRWRMQLAIGSRRVAHVESWHATGRVTRATGLILHATGLRLPVGAACKIEITPRQNHWADAEVVGFNGHTLYLMPQSDISGLPPGARVVPLEAGLRTRIPLPSHDTAAKPVTGQTRHLAVGNNLLGRVLDGAGRPLDELGPLTQVHPAALAAQAINPLE